MWLPCYLWISGCPPLLCYLWIPCDWRLLPISPKSQTGTACTFSPGYLFNRKLCLEFKHSLKNRAVFYQKNSVQQNSQQPNFLHKLTKKQMISKKMLSKIVKWLKCLALFQLNFRRAKCLGRNRSCLTLKTPNWSRKKKVIRLGDNMRERKRLDNKVRNAQDDEKEMVEMR